MMATLKQCERCGLVAVATASDGKSAVDLCMSCLELVTSRPGPWREIEASPAVNVARQYVASYGPYAAGDYAPGQQLVNTEASGEVLWSYQSGDGRGLVYVIDDGQGWPVEVPARATLASEEQQQEELRSDQAGAIFRRVNDRWLISDQAGNVASLSREQAAALLDWLYGQRDELLRGE